MVKVAWPALVALAVFVAGCVGGPEFPRVTPPALSRAEAALQPPGEIGRAFTDVTAASGVSPP